MLGGATFVWVVGGVPPTSKPVMELIPGVGVVVEPATVVPLGCPEEFPPASADWQHRPAATRIRGKAAARIAPSIVCLCDVMMFQP